MGAVEKLIFGLLRRDFRGGSFNSKAGEPDGRGMQGRMLG